MKQRKLFALVALLLCAAMLLTACAKSGGETTTETTQTSAESTAPAAEAAAAADTSTNLRVALKNEPPSLDPYNISDQTSNAVKVQILESLFQMDAEGNVTPLLAESYEFIDDTTLRIQLKQGVKFHNGEELKGSDAVFSLKSAAESSLISQYSGMMDPEGFTVEGDYTFTLKTKMAYSPILNALAAPANAIVCEKTYTEMGDEFARQPIGTGPFAFDTWNTGDSIVLKRFDEYYGEKAKCEKLTFRFITEASSRLIELESGGVDIALDLSNSDLKLAQSNDKLTVYSTPGYQIVYIALNEQREMFQDVNVRKAMHYAVDMQAIVDVVYEGLTEASKTVMPGTINGACADLPQYDYNVELAKQYMAESGYPNGFTCNIVINEDVNRTRIAEMVQAYWAEIGITLEVKQLEQSSFMSALNTLEGLDTCVGGLNNPVGHADTTLFRLFYSENLGSGGNYSAYNNPEVDGLLMEARTKTSWDEQKALYQKAQEIIWDDAVILPVTTPLVTLATSNAVDGLNIRPDMYQRYSTVFFK